MAPLIKKALRAARVLREDLVGERMLVRRYPRESGDFQWKRGAACPRRRVEANGAVIGDRLYLFGGYESLNKVWDRCDVYDLRRDRWVDHFATPAGMAQTHAGISTDRKNFIYILGGQRGPQCSPCTDRCFVFDVEEKKFSELPSLPEPRYVGFAEYWSGRIHVVGGSLPDRFTPAKDHWSIGVQDGKATEQRWKNDVPIPRGGMHRGRAVVNGCMYVIGGSEGDVMARRDDPQFRCDGKSPEENIHGEIYSLEPGAGEWIRLADMPVKLFHTDTTVVAAGNGIFVFGGVENRRTCSNVVWRYDPLADSWERAGTLPYHMKSSFALHFGGRFFVVCGQRARSYSDYRPYHRGSSSVWIAEASCV